MEPENLYGKVKETPACEENHGLNLIFRPFPEMQSKYKQSLDNKAKFLIKIMMMRYQGIMMTLACKLDNWISDNSDMLFQDAGIRFNLLKSDIGNKKLMELM